MDGAAHPTSPKSWNARIDRRRAIINPRGPFGRRDRKSGDGPLNATITQAVPRRVQ
jgi:hypothetical protein